MSDFQEVIVGNEILQFPNDMSDSDISKVIQNYISSGEAPAAASQDLPVPGETYDTKGRGNRIGSATKFMTKPFRELISSGEERIFSKYLGDLGFPESAKATVGLAGDVGIAGLGLLGTGVSGAASVVPELYGLFGAPENKKRQLSRDIMGMFEGTLPGQAGPSSSLFGVSKALQSQAGIEAKAAQAAGIVPPLSSYGEGLATTSKVISEIPIGTKRLAKEGERVAEEAAVALDKIAPPVSKMQVGKNVMSGVSEWLDTTKNTADKLYKEVDKFISGDTYLPALKTVDFIEDIVDTYNSAPNFFNQSGLKPITSILSDLKSGGTINLAQWKVLRAFRSELGESLSSNSGPLAQGIRVGKGRQLHKVLTADLDAAAKASGDKAYTAYKRADNYYKARQKRIEDTLLNVSNVKDPEQAYRYITSIIKDGGAKESSRVLNSIRKSLKGDDFQDVSLGIISNLGRVDDGVFDPAKFLKEWRNISQTGKRLILSGTGKSNAMQEMDNLVMTLDRIDKSGAFEGGRSVGGAYRVRRAAGDVSDALTRILTIGGTATVAGSALPGAASNIITGLVVGTSLGALSAKAMSSPKFLKALNSALANDLSPMNALARSSDAVSVEARMLLQALNKENLESQE
jgi:hypothetical protein